MSNLMHVHFSEDILSCAFGQQIGLALYGVFLKEKLFFLLNAKTFISSYLFSVHYP